MKIIVVSQNSIRKRFLRLNAFYEKESFGEFTIYKSSNIPDLVVFYFGIMKSLKERLSDLIEQYNPVFIISLGFASSIIQNVKIGSVLRFSQVSSVSGPMALWNKDNKQNFSVPVNRPLSVLFETLDENRGRFYEGSLMTTPRLISTFRMKRWVSEEFQVSAIDRDGAYVADLCQHQNLPYALIRSINNDLNTNSSKLISLLGMEAPLGFWRGLITPQHYPSYMRLRLRNLKAQRNLERLLERVLRLELY